MKETMNKYFGYAGKDLWDTGYAGKIPVIPLTTAISKVNGEQHVIKAKPEEEQRHDGYYHAKAFLYVHDEILELLEDRGLTFHTMGINDMAYITIIPKEHMTENKRYTDDMDTLIVMVTAESSDPNYGMYTLEKYMNYIDMAAKDRIGLHFCMYKGLDDNGRLLMTIRESLVIHRFNYKRLYLDVSSLLDAGVHISDVEDFSIPGYANPDDAIEKIGHLGVPAVNISDLWLSKIRRVNMPSHGRFHNMDFNPEMHINSMMGRRKAERELFFREFDSIYDPGLSKKLFDLGVQMAIHETEGEQWVILVPRQALETGKKIPLVSYFGEVNAYNPQEAVETLTTAYSFIELAAEGNFALLLFALEDLDDNDLMATLIYEAAEKYPIDLSRVYVTGHSHNGRFTAEFTRRHQRLVAAAAPLGNEPGQLSPEWTSGFFAISDEQIRKQAEVDTPIIMINGCNELNCMYPLYTDAPFPNPVTPFIALNTKEKRVKSWQRRLISNNCPMKTEEEIYATQYSKDYVERTLGIPADKTEVLYYDGAEVYLADIKNVNGDYHLRICAFQNSPHEMSPEYANMMWSYCRRFARDQETGETIELY